MFIPKNNLILKYKNTKNVPTNKKNDWKMYVECWLNYLFLRKTHKMYKIKTIILWA